MNSFGKILVGAILLGGPGWASAQDAAFEPIQLATNKEISLKVQTPLNQLWRIDISQDLTRWTGLATFRSTTSNLQTDAGAPFAPARFYRASQVTATNALTGDHLATDDGEITIHPINHATFVMTWKDKVIYSDPVGGAAPFQGLPKADLILITHSHTDHFDAATINAVKGSAPTLLVPQAVYQALSASLKTVATVLTNGANTNWLGVSVEAVPAYNLTSAYHPKGTGNGYVLTIGSRRIYISGDTEDIPETRALQKIDCAFLCMNLPFTMPVDKAALLVRGFQPRIVYPYHYSGSDVNRFKQLVGSDQGVEVRLRKWY